MEFPNFIQRLAESLPEYSSQMIILLLSIWIFMKLVRLTVEALRNLLIEYREFHSILKKVYLKKGKKKVANLLINDPPSEGDLQMIIRAIEKLKEKEK